MTYRCLTPGCANPPSSATTRLCHACKARNVAAKQQRARERSRIKPKSDALCKHPGCTSVHHGRSCYCLQHVKQPRGVNAKQPRPGTLALARELLRAADQPPQPLRPPQPVTLWNVVTGEVVEVWE